MSNIGGLMKAFGRKVAKVGYLIADDSTDSESPAKILRLHITPIFAFQHSVNSMGQSRSQFASGKPY
ncbi:MAG: hypothetical protein P8M30_19495 [Planctomycetaceae bacterium]|nr:hypothetical protein [Planctomycetaceae bacterium]MDG2391497.1 hypothetical protein [Planctomycetaceae bacterium]